MFCYLTIQNKLTVPFLGTAGRRARNYSKSHALRAFLALFILYPFKNGTKDYNFIPSLNLSKIKFVRNNMCRNLSYGQIIGAPSLKRYVYMMLWWTWHLLTRPEVSSPTSISRPGLQFMSVC